MTPNKTYIYVLCDPDSLLVRYVGKSDNPKKRFSGHIKDKYDSYKTRWIKSLKLQNKLPVLKIIEKINYESWKEAEKKWISFYRIISGKKLTNVTEGGDSAHHTLETKKKLSEISKKRWENPEYRKNRSEETKKQWTPEFRKKRSEEVKEQWDNPDFRKKRSEEVKAQWTPEFKIKRSKEVKKTMGKS
jgi:predicted GIY-YIG superfamily endonuclease